MLTRIPLRYCLTMNCMSISYPSMGWVLASSRSLQFRFVTCETRCVCHSVGVCVQLNASFNHTWEIYCIYNQVFCVSRFRGKDKRHTQLKHMRPVAIAVVYFESKASIHYIVSMRDFICDGHCHCSAHTCAEIGLLARQKCVAFVLVSNSTPRPVGPVRWVGRRRETISWCRGPVHWWPELGCVGEAPDSWPATRQHRWG